MTSEQKPGKPGVKDTLRNLVDVPEKIAIAIGAGGVALSVFAPALLPASLLLIAGGWFSLEVTRGVWPKKKQTA